MKYRFVLLFAIVFLANINMVNAKKYYFQFVYSIGTNTNSEVLIFYQLVDNSGKSGNNIPINVSNNQVEILNIDKKSTKEIRFTGYFIENNKTRKNVLPILLTISNLNTKKGVSNKVLIHASEIDNKGFIPVTELINQIAQKRYYELLKRPKDSLFNYNKGNVFPIGHFILYNPVTKDARNAYVMPSNSSPFVEISKTIVDNYVISKQMGVDIGAEYQRIANISSSTGKQKFYKYFVSVDTLQILHWQSNISEMKFLNDEVKNGNLDFLKNEISQSEWKFYFISTCVKIKEFQIFAHEFDSISTSNSANVNVPNDAVSLTLKANVLYSSNLNQTNYDNTSIYYTGFGVRDYTTYLRNLLSQKDLNEQILEAKNQYLISDTAIHKSFVDFQKLDTTIINFTTTDLIISFIESINEKEIISTSDTISDEQKQIITAINENYKIYNNSLQVVKNKIIDYNAKKANYFMLNSKNKEQIPFDTPKNIQVDDLIIEEALSKINKCRVGKGELHP